MAGVLAGGLTAEWIGQQSGAAGYDHSLVASKAGALLHQPLMLGGEGLLAFWPLAAGLTAGGLEMAALIRRRRGERSGRPA